ncbi:hypothetical protein [Dickeya chrysanthemi]|uniref:hypothetical protein n=1 Tax=Dickeya chrysanthemi TaxID=556 RepID=UPI0033413454
MLPFLLLAGCNSAILNPKGQIGHDEKQLLITSVVLMLIVVIPVIVMTIAFAWKYRASNTKARYEPDWSHSTAIEVVVWSIPCVIILRIPGAVAWRMRNATCAGTAAQPARRFGGPAHAERAVGRRRRFFDPALYAGADTTRPHAARAAQRGAGAAGRFATAELAADHRVRACDPGRAEQALREVDNFYVTTLSPNGISYKGMVLPDKLSTFYPDLQRSDLSSSAIVFHQRFSTNTLPRWPLAHPFRLLAHNGEINTIEGNRRSPNGMTSRRLANLTTSSAIDLTWRVEVPEATTM